MRARLRAVIALLMAGVVTALSVPLAISRIDVGQQELLTHRRDELRGLVSMAEAGSTGGGRGSLLAEFRRYERVHDVRVALFDPAAGVRLASSDTSRWADADVRARVTRALDGRRDIAGPLVLPWHDRDLVVAEPVTRDGAVLGALVTLSPSDELRRSGAVVLGLIAVVAMLTLAGCVAVASRIASWVLRPIEQLDHAAHEFGSGRLATRVAAAGGPRELRRLAGTFNVMAARVEAAIDRERRFVADASHQLRNPLGALRLRIDQLEFALRPGHEEEHDHVRREAERLGRILDDLLRLARADAGVGEPALVEVSGIVDERLFAWAPLARNRRITVVGGPHATAHAWLEPTALSTSLDVVLDNALKFTPRGGTVTILLQREGAELALSVSDTGPGLERDELGRVTDRFWRSPRHQNVAGTGLGLSIARELLRTHGGRVDLASGSDGGLTVRLVFPAAEHSLRHR
ncbi:sensor histidine kinase [Prauserella cavernicola]|uniref:histidine kinase n=1 Tax=Prauserella cavernicola TaxID=2800127 RepID=A0A934QQ69_9PSEU|nr:HAMP domain-containing sensor histidine kinase [Prauserella cavernicola]MBK1783473.1 HAMP domain-containing histidine kinase [Prauserella cavernicola]